jgi:hypothetical protein
MTIDGSHSQPGIRPNIPNGRRNKDDLQFASREVRRNHASEMDNDMDHMGERKGATKEPRKVLFRESPQLKETQWSSNGQGISFGSNEEAYIKKSGDSGKRGAISIMTANETEKLYNEYVSLLEPDSNQEMLVFAVTSLDPMMPNIIHEVMANKALYLKMVNLVDINLPAEHHEAQIRILSEICEHLNEQRAVDGMQQRIVQRILKSFPLQPKSFQKIFLALISKHIHKSRFHVDVATLVSLMLCPFEDLQELGAKLMVAVSDPNIVSKSNFGVQFENHVRFLLETSLLKRKNFDFKNLVLNCLANLCLLVQSKNSSLKRPSHSFIFP